jgi:tRNA modification GTPase
MSKPTYPTTVAIQTPPGLGGIAVLAMRGPAVEAILAEAFRPGASPERGQAAGAGTLQLGHIVDGQRVIDQAIVARCGELAEINIHGGPAVAAAVLGRLMDLGAVVMGPIPAATDCFRPSHPAMHNPAIGKELLQALPDAASASVAAALTWQWSAGISKLACDVLDNISRLRLDELPARADALRAAAGRRAMMRRVLCPPAGRYAEVVLAGPPNAGKSTLANALWGRAASIVHDRPGTTRDWVRELALLRGLPVWLTDTAGLWDTTDDIDSEAVKRSARRIADADLVLLLGEGRLEALPDWLDELRLPPATPAPVANAPVTPPPATPAPVPPPPVPMLRVATKIDLTPPPADADAAVCAPAGQGLDELAARIIDALGLADFDPRLPSAFTDRQEALLARAADALDAGQTAQAGIDLRELLGCNQEEDLTQRAQRTQR